jgi:3-dehydro-4-phosphotetronate decarboxylase
LKCENLDNVIPPLTAYYVMRVGRLPLVPYYPPGDEALAIAIGQVSEDVHSVLLANHGPIVSGPDLNNAVYAMEELEETAKLYLLLGGRETSPLSTAQVDKLKGLSK